MKQIRDQGIQVKITRNMGARQKPEEAGSTAKLDEALQKAEERMRAAGRIADPDASDTPTTTAHSQPRMASKTAMFEHVFEERDAAEPQTKRDWAGWLSGLLVLGFVVFVGFLAYRPLDKGHFGEHRVPVELQANAPGVQFTVDGHATTFARVNLGAGPHQVEASAPGFETQTKTITVSESGSAPPVVFALQSLLPSLRVTTSFKDAKYILDGDEPMDLDNGSLTEDHLISGTHSLRILAGGGEQIFALNFTTQPGMMPVVRDHSEIESVSALITSSVKDSAKLFATPDWKVSSSDGSGRAVAADGVDFTKLVATSEDGQTQKLSRSTSRVPVLTVLLRRLPTKIPVLVSANVSDAAIVIDGRRLEQRLAGGHAALSLLPGIYKVGLVNRDYDDSAIQELHLIKRSPAGPVPLQFVLKPAGHRALVQLGPEARGAVVLVDGAKVNPSPIGGGRVSLLVSAGHHLITIKRKNFEDVRISQDFPAGETVNIGSAGRR